MMSSFDNVLWIGGSPCAGKSTIANLLGERHQIDVYNCDHAFDAHQRRAVAEQQPTLHGLTSISCDEIWMAPVAAQVARVRAIYREEFPMILDDLAQRPSYRRVLVEGAALMPTLLHELGIGIERAVWVVPTPEFQRTHYAQRSWVVDVLAECSDPEQAFENWMKRDELFARWVGWKAAMLDYAAVTISGRHSVDEMRNLVGMLIGLL